jgi:2,3-bisphosphoglycerate-independent phosphoglycerate mutase
VYVHIESTDEVSHEQRLDLKLKAIEDFDSRLIGRVMAKLGDGAAYCVLPDHPVPLRLGKHTRTPVPFAVYQPGNTPDAVTGYGERTALNGSLGALKGGELMDLLLK